MNNLLLIMLGLIGAALALLLGLIALQNALPDSLGGPCTYDLGPLNSYEIEDFALTDAFLDLPPVFEGEIGSDTYICAPEEESEYLGVIESFGITTYSVVSTEAGKDLLGNLAMFDEDSTSYTIAGHDVVARENKEYLFASYSWQQELQVLEILVSGDADSIDQSTATDEEIEEYFRGIRTFAINLIENILGDE